MPGLLQIAFISVRFSPLFVFFLILLLAACSSVPQSSGSISPTQIEQTVQASVEQRLTEIAPTPDIEATVNFRLTAISAALTATPTAVVPATVTPPSNPTSDAQPGLIDRIGKFIGDVISALPTVFNFFVNLWNTVGQFGTIAQITCCGFPLLLGGGAVITIKFK